MGQHTVGDAGESTAKGGTDERSDGPPTDGERTPRPHADPHPEPAPDASGSGFRASLANRASAGLFTTAKLVADGVTQMAIRVHDRTRFADVGRGSYNAIVSFHGVGDDPEVGLREFVSTAEFRRTLERIGSDAEFVPLSAITRSSRRQRVAVTFDDGLRSVAENALPVLRDLGVPATVFCNPDFLDDRDPELFAARHGTTRGEGLTLTDGQVRELANDPLISIGNHTSTHVDLESVDDSELRDQVLGSRRQLEERYGADVDAFAYPYGAYDDGARQLVERTHDVSVTTSPFLVDDGRGPHRLPRLSGTDPLPALSWELTPASDLLHRVRAPWKDTSTGPENLG